MTNVVLHFGQCGTRCRKTSYTAGQCGTRCRMTSYTTGQSVGNLPTHVGSMLPTYEHVCTYIP